MTEPLHPVPLVLFVCGGRARQHWVSLRVSDVDLDNISDVDRAHSAL